MFQAPKGMRDFYPADMAVRRYIEGVWREVSIAHGFDEVDGPTFEHVELYTHKSGPAIVNEIFGVFSGKDETQVSGAAQGTAPYALRPEFTPTLARMVAAKAASLPMPIKWFAIPNHFRAERPQRGRLREFVQWNVDFLGDQETQGDAEVIATAVRALERLGLTSKDVTVKISHRKLVGEGLERAGIGADRTSDAMGLLDKRGKIPEDDFARQSQVLGLSLSAFDEVCKAGSNTVNGYIATLEQQPVRLGSVAEADPASGTASLLALADALNDQGILKWCEVDLSIVRGLAYYTGTVFEIHEATGAERAIAGGGRYDKLIEGFGGPALPACGFGMGDVVLGLVLKDKGLLGEERYMEPLRPDAFVIAADDAAAARLPAIVADLRRGGVHVRHSYKTTRNVGKLLGDAGKSRARLAVILGKELAEEAAMVKDLEAGTQELVKVEGLVDRLRRSP